MSTDIVVELMTYGNRSVKILVCIDRIRYMKDSQDGKHTLIYFDKEDLVEVKESITEILKRSQAVK